jgi:hypothetical protein
LKRALRNGSIQSCGSPARESGRGLKLKSEGASEEEIYIARS